MGGGAAPGGSAAQPVVWAGDRRAKEGVPVREIPFGFKPGGRGLTKVLGGLEAEVMEVVWRLGRVSVRDALRALGGKRRLAYTTVMTTMTRLARKGLLEREPEGRYFLYRPALTREEFLDRVAATVLDGLLEEFSRPVLSHLVERIGQEDEAALRELEEAIRRRREEGRK